jgi:hypothetical protein
MRRASYCHRRPKFFARTKRPVSTADIAFQTERHSQANLGHRCRKNPASSEHVDSVGEAMLVIHVVEKIGFDIEDRLQLLCLL